MLTRMTYRCRSPAVIFPCRSSARAEPQPPCTGNRHVLLTSPLGRLRVIGIVEGVSFLLLLFIAMPLKYLAGKPASTPRSFGKSAGTGELALTQQEKPGQLDMTGAGGAVPKDYAILPVPMGGFETTKSNVLLHKAVKDLQGKTIGTIENFLMDTHSGRIEYAVIAIDEGHHLHPVPWTAINLTRDSSGGVVPVIDTAKYQLMPSVSMHEMKDLSPSVKELVQEMQVLRRTPAQSREVVAFEDVRDQRERQAAR
jgi:sporulation protein YlmC with PRC-barrel domain